MTIQQILKDSNYKLTEFSQKAIDNLESQIITSQDKKGKNIYKVKCLVRAKEIVLTPEEIVRQLYLDKLINEYHYPINKFQIEYMSRNHSI